MQTLKFDVHGMTCGGCTGSVQRALSKIDGVSHVDVALSPDSATLEADIIHSAWRADHHSLRTHHED